jgi:hypothetical protein
VKGAYGEGKELMIRNVESLTWGFCKDDGR